MLNLFPKTGNLKKKHSKMKLNKFIFKQPKLTYGRFGLYSCFNCIFTLQELESLRKFLVRRLRVFNRNNKFKLWFKIFPHKMLTKKPKGSRMGKGKGVLDCWVCSVTKGQIFIEFDGPFLNSENINDAFVQTCSYRLNKKLRLFKF